MNEVESKPAHRGLPLWWLWLGLSLLTVALAAWVRLLAPGWGLIIYGLILCGLMLGHPVFHGVGALRGGRHGRLMPIILVLSNLFFLLGFGFQVDVGDGPNGFMGLQIAADRILNGSADIPTVPERMEGLYFGLSLGSLVALIASWAVIAVLGFGKSKDGSREEAKGALP